MKSTLKILTIIFIIIHISEVSKLRAQVLEQDSLALISLYNNTDGNNWKNKSNWLTGSVSTWFGITVSGGRVEIIDLRDNNLSGNLPIEIEDLTALKRLYLDRNQLYGDLPNEIYNLINLERLFLYNNDLTGDISADITQLTNLDRLYLFNNKFTALPDLSAITGISWVDVQNNQFTFEDLEPNIWIPTFNYSPQDSLGIKKDTLLDQGSSLNITVNVGGTQNQYQWKKNNVIIPGATGSTYTIDSVEAGSGGIYNCQITNSIVPDLILNSRPIKVEVSLILSSTDSLALVALYDSTDGAKWLNNENWLNGPISTWYGVLIQDGYVTLIKLNNNNLTGKIPKQIGDLQNLSYLGLDGNQLTGEIPSEIGNLLKLETLNLFNNNLNGIIPLEISNLTNLEVLSLGGNQLTGNIPIEFGNLTQLGILQLNYNQLSGNIPPEIGNLTELLNLSLENNQLMGNLPSTIQNLLNLKWMNIKSNNINGEIPFEIGSLTNLVSLNLSNNQFSGKIPKEIGQLDNLEHLYLFRNQLSDTIPIELYNLTKLISFYLSENLLTGSIPAEIGNLTSLKFLYLQRNNLMGELPPEIANLNNLERLYLEQNKIIGPFPTNFKNHSNLIDIQLFNNQFTDLPDLSAISTLLELEIHNNKFTFEDIEPNMGIPNFYYAPQDSVGKYIDTTITVNTQLDLFVNVGGSGNKYEWRKDGIIIPDADEDSYTIDSTNIMDSGIYTCKISNSIAPDLILTSREMIVNVSEIVGLEELSEKLPTKYALYQNFPNPFNPTTTIKYQIANPNRQEGREHKNGDQHILLIVYDIIGREVAILVDQIQKPGYYEIIWEAIDQPSGIYFYKLILEQYSKSKKMILLK